MDPSTLKIDASNHRLRRVGRLIRRRMRIDEADLRNGIHTDGPLSVVISGLGNAGEGGPETFQWWTSRPVALVITRSGVDGEDVSFLAGPVRWGTGVRRSGDRAGISYIAFAYDTERDMVAAPASTRSKTPVATMIARLLGSPASA